MNDAKGTVLIVDDEEPIRNILSYALQKQGYVCELAKRGDEALQSILMKDFDIALLDIDMPGMSGIEVLSQLITHRPDISVVMVTAIQDTKIAVQAMKLGAYDYVIKPFNLDDLGLRVEKALERRRLVLENKRYHLHLEQRAEHQAGQIQQYYQEALQALVREQIAIQKLEGI
jgi:putative two-component system response regulator